MEAKVLLSYPKSTHPKEYDRALRLAHHVPHLSLMPLWLETLKTPRLGSSISMLDGLMRLDQPESTLFLIRYSSAPDDPAWNGEDCRQAGTLRIHAARTVYTRSIETARRGADFPEPLHEALKAAIETTSGQLRCMLTVAAVALGRAEHVEGMADAFPGCMWDQEKWREVLFRSPQEAVQQFVVRMVLEDRLHMHLALEANPGLAPRMLAGVAALPDEPRLTMLESLTRAPDASVAAEARRLHGELAQRLRLPMELPPRLVEEPDPLKKRVLRLDTTHVALTCAFCFRPASAVRIEGSEYRYDGPFGKNIRLNRKQVRALLAALPAGSAAEIARTLAGVHSTTFFEMDPFCRGCGDVVCTACWNPVQTGSSGGSDIGMWYDDFSATCPKGHGYTYSLGAKQIP